MIKLEKVKVKEHIVHLYSSIVDIDNIKLFIIHDGDIFMDMKENIIDRLDTSLKNIVVALVHSNNRLDEYTPWKENVFRSSYPFSGQGDIYLSFLIDELKPYIENTYNISILPKHTYLGGSSLGGLISLYGILNYPNDFGGAICISSSFWYDNFIDYIKDKKDYNTDQYIYMDVGDREGKGNITLHRDVLTKTSEVYDILIDKGFKKENIVFKIKKGMSHRSNFFIDRLHDGILYLYKK